MVHAPIVQKRKLLKVHQIRTVNRLLAACAAGFFPVASYILAHIESHSDRGVCQAGDAVRETANRGCGTSCLVAFATNPHDLFCFHSWRVAVSDLTAEETSPAIEPFGKFADLIHPEAAHAPFAPRARS